MSATKSRSVARADIQGLRAIAVGLVILFHLRPGWVPGGFVGVDVFFVISGYLITSSLISEAARTGTIRLAKFWGRRIRRLLPAATVVLLATLVGTYLLLPMSLWPLIVRQSFASAISIQNWVLAKDAVSYLHQTTQPSPLQHFWSLSVEEQFYIVWPVLIVAITFVSVKLRRHSLPALRVAVPVIAAASLVFSVIYSRTSPEIAYFSTFTRSWELMIGAALAVWMPSLRLPRWVSLTAFIGGLAAIAASIFVIDATTVFPGYAALLPTLGAAGVIGGGIGAGRSVVRSVLECRPLTFLGDISYSLYLWHWPAIVVVSAVLGTPALPAWACVLILVGSLLVASASKKFVEDVFQNTIGRPREQDSRFARVRKSPFMLAAALLSFTAVSGGLLYADLVHVTTAQRAAQSPQNTPGGNILDPAFTWSSFPNIKVAPIPDILSLQNHVERQLSPECLATFPETQVKTCEAGDPEGNKTVFLVGDSHASQWLPAFDQMGQKYGWKVIVAGKQSCPLTTRGAEASGQNPAYEYSQCTDWNTNVRTFVQKLHPDLVVTSAADYAFTAPPVDDAAFGAVLGASYERQYAFIQNLGIPLVAIKELPIFTGFSAPDCLSKPGATNKSCSKLMTAALVTPRSRIAEAEKLDPRVRKIDVDSLICPDGICNAAVGNVVTYRDDNHITDPFARSLSWAIEKQLQPDMPGLFE